jgi:hypothetical protein
LKTLVVPLFLTQSSNKQIKKAKNMNQSSLLYKSPEELLDQSVRDSPFFRETIATFETDMEEVLKWLDGLNKTLRLYTDDLTSKEFFLVDYMYTFLTESNEVTTALVGKLGMQNLSSSSLGLGKQLYIK